MERSLVTLPGGVSGTLVSLGPSKEEVLPKLDEMEERLKASRQTATERRAQAEETSQQIATARRNIELQLTQAEYAAKEAMMLEAEATKTFRKIRDLMTEKDALAGQLANLGGELDITMMRLSDLEGLTTSLTDTRRAGGNFVLGFKHGLGNYTPSTIAATFQQTSQEKTENIREFRQYLDNQDFEGAWEVIHTGISDVKTMDDQFFQMLEQIQDKKADLRLRNDRIQERITTLSTKVDEARAKIRSFTCASVCGCPPKVDSSRTTGRSGHGTCSTASTDPNTQSCSAATAVSFNSLTGHKCCYAAQLPPNPIPPRSVPLPYAPCLLSGLPSDVVQQTLCKRCNATYAADCPKCGYAIVPMNADCLNCGFQRRCQTCNPTCNDVNNANRCANNLQFTSDSERSAVGRQVEGKQQPALATSAPRVQYVPEDSLRRGYGETRGMKSADDEKEQVSKRDFSSQYNLFPVFQPSKLKTVEELLSMVRQSRDRSPETRPAPILAPKSAPTHPPTEALTPASTRLQAGDPLAEVAPENREEPECTLEEMQVESVNSTKAGKAKVVEKFVRLTQLFKNKKKAQLPTETPSQG